MAAGLVADLFQLLLLLADQLQHSVHLCFLFLLQLLVNLAQTGIALVMRIAVREGSHASQGGWAGCSVAVAYACSVVAARHFAGARDGRIVEV